MFRGYCFLPSADSSTGPARVLCLSVSLQILPTVEFAPSQFSFAPSPNRTTRLDPLPGIPASSPNAAASPSKTCCSESPKHRCRLRSSTRKRSCHQPASPASALQTCPAPQIPFLPETRVSPPPAVPPPPQSRPSVSTTPPHPSSPKKARQDVPEILRSSRLGCGTKTNPRSSLPSKFLFTSRAGAPPSFCEGGFLGSRARTHLRSQRVSPRTSLLHHRHHHLRRILLRVMHRVVRHHSLLFIVVIPAGVQVPVEPRKIAARNLNPQRMPRLKIIARIQRLQRYLVDLPRLHPNQRLVVPIAIAQPLDRFVQVVSPPIRIHIDHFHRKVRILRVRRNIKCRRNRPAQLRPFLKRFRRVHQNIVSCFHLALVERPRLHRRPRATHIPPIRRHRIHRIVRKRIRLVRRRSSSRNQRPISRQRIRTPAARQIHRHRLRTRRRPRLRRLPLIHPHREIRHLRHRVDLRALLALQKSIEKAVRNFRIVQPRVAHASLADHRILCRSCIGAVPNGRHDHPLLIADSVLRRFPHVVV